MTFLQVEYLKLKPVTLSADKPLKYSEELFNEPLS